MIWELFTYFILQKSFLNVCAKKRKNGSDSERVKVNLYTYNVVIAAPEQNLNKKAAPLNLAKGKSLELDFSLELDWSLELDNKLLI